MRQLPKAIIYVNQDISTSVLEMLQKQLHITQTLDGYIFDALIESDTSYLSNLNILPSRLLIVRDALDFTNRDLADLVIFVKLGLAAVEVNKVGPHGITVPVINITWSKLGIYSE